MWTSHGVMPLFSEHSFAIKCHQAEDFHSLKKNHNWEEMFLSYEVHCKMWKAFLIYVVIVIWISIWTYFKEISSARFCIAWAVSCAVLLLCKFTSAFKSWHAQNNWSLIKQDLKSLELTYIFQDVSPPTLVSFQGVWTERKKKGGGEGGKEKKE